MRIVSRALSEIGERGETNCKCSFLLNDQYHTLLGAWKAIKTFLLLFAITLVCSKYLQV